MSGGKRHHHGDLRRALVAAGVDLVEEGGPDALSIRGAAARAGVSHAAPAHHFPSLAHLRTAVVAEGFRRFAREMEEEIARAPDTPRDRLLGACLGYVSFALGGPSLFQLMHGGSTVLVEDDDLAEARGAAYAVLRRVCAPLAPGPAGAEGAELLVWSLVHGYATLTLRYRGGPFQVADPHETFRAIFPELPLRPGAAEEDGF